MNLSLCVETDENDPLSQETGTNCSTSFSRSSPPVFLQSAASFTMEKTIELRLDCDAMIKTGGIAPFFLFPPFFSDAFPATVEKLIRVVVFPLDSRRCSLAAKRDTSFDCFPSHVVSHVDCGFFLLISSIRPGQQFSHRGVSYHGCFRRFSNHFHVDFSCHLRSRIYIIRKMYYVLHYNLQTRFI